MAGCEVLVTSAAPPVKLVGTTERRYAPGHVNTGAIIMALWQFTTIAALIGVLLIYVMVLTNRLGATNALLKRIEEALVKPQSATGNTRATVAGSAEDMTARRPASEPATQAGPLEITDAPEVPMDRRVSFLTVRDLKVIARSGRRSSDGTVGMSPLFREAMERKRAEARPLAESGQSHEDQPSDVVIDEVSVASLVTEETVVASAVAGEVRVASVGSHEAMEASVGSRETVEESGEPRSQPASMQGLAGSLPLSVQELATATYEIRDFLESANVAATEDVAPASPEVVAPTPDEPDTRFASNDEPASEAPAAAVAANDESGAEPDTPIATTEPQPVAAAQPAAAAQPIDEDLIERRRKRDAQLILSAQRRRRRTRGF